MPAYLCHGFRWHRPSIRVFVIVQDIEDASPDWIANADSTRSLLDAFYNLFDFLPADVEADAAAGPAAAPSKGKSRKDKESAADAAAAAAGPPPGVVRRSDGRDDVLALQDGSAVKLLEEFDPARLDEMSRPHAYVADYVARIDLSVSVLDEMARYERLQRRAGASGDRGPGLAMAGPSDETPGFLGAGETEGSASSASSKKKKGAGWFGQLRDQLQRGEPIRWYIVVNNDEERGWGEGDDGDTYDEDQEEAVEGQRERQQQEGRTTPAALDRFLDRGFDADADANANATGSDSHELRRLQLRYELGASGSSGSKSSSSRTPTGPIRTAGAEAGGGAGAATPRDAARTRRLQRQPPPPLPLSQPAATTPPLPFSSPPMLRPKPSRDSHSSSSGLRRLFGRSKGGS